MISVKELKSLELSSYTIIFTAIQVLFSVIVAILIALIMGISTPNGFGVAIYLIPTIIVGTFMYSIYQNFSNGFIYNLLATKMNTIKIAFNDEKEIIKVSTTETAILCAMIATIQVILLYLVSVLILPLLINTTLQTLLFSGQQALAYSFYQLLVVISQPVTIATMIFGTFIITFIFTLLGCYIYNFIAGKGKGVNLSLSKENELTTIDSIDQLKLAIALTIVGGILNLILVIITIISGGDAISGIINIIVGFIVSFACGALIAIFYNFLAPKLGKLKLELIDQ